MDWFSNCDYSRAVWACESINHRIGTAWFFSPCDFSLGVKDVTLGVLCQCYLGTPNMLFSSPYITFPRQYGVQAVLWICCGIQSILCQYTGPTDAFLSALTLSRCVKKSKLLQNMQVNGNGCEDSPSRYPVMSARTPGVTPAATTASYTLPGTPTLLEEHSTIKSKSCMCIHFDFAGLVDIWWMLDLSKSSPF